MDYPRLTPGILCALVGVLCLAIAQALPDGRVEWLRMTLVFGGWILLAVAVVLIGDWLAYRIEFHREQGRRVAAICRETVILDKLRLLQPAQAELLRTYGVDVVTIIGLPEARHIYRIPGTDLEPDDPFMTEFLSDDGYYLTPIGRYSEGSKQRVWAEAVTKLMLDYGFAEKAAGPRSARWIDREGGLAALGME